MSYITRAGQFRKSFMNSRIRLMPTETEQKIFNPSLQRLISLLARADDEPASLCKEFRHTTIDS
jgi:hypothetical protein